MSAAADDLFPEIQQVLSPKLAWVKRHDVVILYDKLDPACWFVGLREWHAMAKNARDFFAKETAYNGDLRIGEGDTEEDAICDFCIKNDIAHYNIETK